MGKWAFALVLVLSPLFAKAADAKRPNILIIVADDQGYNDLGVQGSKDIPTPNIDTIAANGIRFTNGYVSGPYCSPTRAGLMTGRYQTRFGHEFNPGGAATTPADVGLPPTETTLADRLQAGGYSTGMVGKWHLGYDPKFHPLKRGFQEYFGFLGGMHDYIDWEAEDHNRILRGTQPVVEQTYLTDAFGREAAAYIDRHKKQDKPFFLYWTFNAVHVPLEATPTYMSRFESIKDTRRRTLAAMTSAMDDAVGLILAKLRETGLEEDTLIFYISDNGGPEANASNNFPLRGHKAQTLEGGVRVPWMVQWKGHLPAGKTDDRPVIQLDIHATALAAAGVTPPADAKKLDGVNLLPYFTGGNSGRPHEALYWRFGRQMAIRLGDWKLVRSSDDLSRQELFDLSKDVGEAHDLSTQRPEKVKELQAAWDKWDAENVPAKWGPAARPGKGKGKVKGKNKRADQPPVQTKE